VNIRQERGSPQAVCLNGRGGARRLDEEAVERWRPANDPLWVELDEAGERDRAWLAGGSGLQEDHVAQFLREGAWPVAARRGKPSWRHASFSTAPTLRIARMRRDTGAARTPGFRRHHAFRTPER
jgi:hypothetical protein